MSKALKLSKKYRTILNRAGINTPLRLAHFFAQLDHESKLQPTRENTNYSEKRLLQVFPRYFTKSQASQYARKPQAIANRVYANRMKNGNEKSGDGWRYRGGGYMQHTGRQEYEILTKNLGVNYLENPDLLLNEADAMLAAIDYWSRLKLNIYADKDNLDAISDLINIGRLTARVGDANGYADRKNKLNKYKKVF